MHNITMSSSLYNKILSFDVSLYVSLTSLCKSTILHFYHLLYINKKKDFRIKCVISVSSVSQSCPTLCNPWTETYQASLFITIFRSLLKLMYIHSVMPSKQFILCCPLLSLPSIYPSIRLFSNETALFIRWPKYWNFSFSISPSYEYS